MVDWRVRVLTPKYKLDGPYSILVFLGPVPDVASEWRNSETLAGSVEIFANSNPGQCENCRNHSGMITEGFVYLNHVLAMSDLESFEPHIVAPYLKDNLHWRVLKVCRASIIYRNGSMADEISLNLQQGEAVDIARDLPELKVSVVEVPVHFAPGDDMPRRMGNVKPHSMITAGRLGGAS